MRAPCRVDRGEHGDVDPPLCRSRCPAGRGRRAIGPRGRRLAGRTRRHSSTSIGSRCWPGDAEQDDGVNVPSRSTRVTCAPIALGNSCFAAYTGSILALTQLNGFYILGTQTMRWLYAPHRGGPHDARSPLTPEPVRRPFSPPPFRRSRRRLAPVSRPRSGGADTKPRSSAHLTALTGDFSHPATRPQRATSLGPTSQRGRRPARPAVQLKIVDDATTRHRRQRHTS